MRFLSYGTLWWLLLGLPIIFFYLLKLKRTPARVPAVFLWRRAMDEMEASAPFRRLRKNLLLILQLAILIAMVLALMHPLIPSSGFSGGNTIIIIDATASMGARDENGGSRLETARRIAGEIVEGLQSQSRAAIIECAARIRVSTGWTSDRKALASAIRDITQTDQPGDLGEAVLLAGQLARAESGTEVVVISDGGAFGETKPVRFVGVGRRNENVGIIALNSRVSPAGPVLFSSIVNFGARRVDAEVELRIDGRLVDARRMALDPGQNLPLAFGSLPSAGGMAELRLLVEDDLECDNVAYAHVPDAGRVRVGVSTSNAFLMRALVANPALEVKRIDSRPSEGEFDCLVLDGPRASGLASGPTSIILINPDSSGDLLRVVGEAGVSSVTSLDHAHPVNSFLSYGGLQVKTVRRMETAPWLRSIVISGDQPLIWAGDDGGRRVVVLGFDLADSDLPLKVEFPILLANSIGWLSGRSSEASTRAVRSGSPLVIPTGGSYVKIQTPGGEVVDVPAQDGEAIFTETRRVGVYRLADGEWTAAVSLLDGRESDTTPREPGGPASEGLGEAGAESGYERPIWRWAALLALAILSLEWWAYHRRPG